MEMIFRPGDVLLPGAPAGKQGYISRKILEATQSGPENPSRVSHAMIVIEGGTIDETWVVEMTFPKMRIVKLSEAYPESFIVWYRPKYADKTAINAMLAELRKRADAGERYAIMPIIELYLDSILCDVVSWLANEKIEIRFFSRIRILSRLLILARIKKKAGTICSYVVVDACHRYLGLFNSKPGWTPDDIDDHCSLSSDWITMGEIRDLKAVG